MLSKLQITDFMRRFRHVWRSETAATAIEYGLIAGLISISFIVAANLIGESLDAIFSSVSTVLEVGASRATSVASAINL